MVFEEMSRERAPSVSSVFCGDESKHLVKIDTLDPDPISGGSTPPGARLSGVVIPHKPLAVTLQKYEQEYSTHWAAQAWKRKKWDAKEIWCGFPILFLNFQIQYDMLNIKKSKKSVIISLRNDLNLEIC